MKKFTYLYSLFSVSLLVSCLSSNDDDYKLQLAQENNLSYVEPIVVDEENTLERCQNKIDDDDDGLTDCDDPQCKIFLECISASSASGVPEAVPEDTYDKCTNEEDDDLDGNIDCEDEDCSTLEVCALSSSTDLVALVAAENTFKHCTNNVDDDGDGNIDCEDEDCFTVEICQRDSTELQALEPEENTYRHCTNGLDDDGDGDIDCLDTECALIDACFRSSSSELTTPLPDENTLLYCQDGYDNDDDKLTDCKDPECQVFTICTSSSSEGIVIPENTAARCQDKIDNDEDGNIDCLDTECAVFVFCMASSTSEIRENTFDKCSDTIDNDGDDQIDCQDEDCQELKYCLDESSSGGTEFIYDSIIPVPGIMQFEDFTSPGTSTHNSWPFFDTDPIRKDKLFYSDDPTVGPFTRSYPDAAADSNGVELQACWCDRPKDFNCEILYDESITTKDANGNTVAMGGICLGFMETQEMLTYVLDVQEEGTYVAEIYGATGMGVDEKGDPWGADSKGFNISFFVTDEFLVDNIYSVQDTAIITPHSEAPGTYLPDWNRIGKVREDLEIEFRDKNGDFILGKVLFILQSNGNPYNLDYIKFRKK